jgi:hypothetical protein
VSAQAFRVHPQNHRCFLFRGKPFRILTSAEHYGAVLNADFDYDAYLAEMQRTGQNQTRVFTFYRETADSISGPGDRNTLAPAPQASVLPWERAPEGGKAADGLEKFDLNRWNPRYFARLADYVEKCGRHGVVCEIVLFCNPYDQQKFDLFPCSAASNVNGVGATLAGFRDFMSLRDEGVTAFQERFVRRIAEELNPYDNLYYEICNEPSRRDDPTVENEAAIVSWQARLARVLREAEEGLPNRHLIAVNSHFEARSAVGTEPGSPGQTESAVCRHDDLAYFENPDMDIVNYHYISAKESAEGLSFARLQNDLARPGLIRSFLARRDGYGKPVVFDETYSGIVRGSPERYGVNRAEAWETMLAGGAGYSNLDWTFTQEDETGRGKSPVGDGRRLDGGSYRQWLAVLRALLSDHDYDLGALVPAGGLVARAVAGYGWAASTDGRGRYILYVVDEDLYRLLPCRTAPVTLELALPAGRYRIRTFDPRTGRTDKVGDGAVDRQGSRSGPSHMSLAIPPFSEDVAVMIDRAQ